jgi:uncharacterized protein YrrD
MPKISDIVGKAIISAETGEHLGKVADVLLDPPSRHAVGLVISGGILGAETVLPFGDVQTLGKDAIVARTGAGKVGRREWRQQDIDAARSSTFKHRPVLTSTGRALGEVHDVLLNGQTGIVEALEVAERAYGGLGHKRWLLPRGEDVTIGADAVVVSDTAAAVVERTEEDGA